MVTSAWQKFTYDFVAPCPTDNRWHIIRPRIHRSGQVWIDNFLLYRHDEGTSSALTPHAVSFDT